MKKISGIKIAGKKIISISAFAFSDLPKKVIIALTLAAGITAAPTFAESVRVMDVTPGHTVEDLRLLKKYESLVGGGTVDGSFKHCPAPTPEMIKVAREEALPHYMATYGFKFHYSMIAPNMPPFFHDQVVPQVTALTGLKPLRAIRTDHFELFERDPDYWTLFQLILGFSDNFYEELFSVEELFNIAQPVLVKATGREFPEFNDEFLHDVKILSDQLQQPGIDKENMFFSVIVLNADFLHRKPLANGKPLRGDVIRSYFLDDPNYVFQGKILKDINPQLYEADKDDFYRYILLQLVYRGIIGNNGEKITFKVDYPSDIASGKPQLALEAYKHMLETGCYTPFDAAFLYALYHPEPEAASQ